MQRSPSVRPAHSRRYVRPAVPQPARRRGPNDAALRALFSVLFLILLASAGLLCYELGMVDNIYPGVRLGGVDVGGLSRAEAMDRLAAARAVAANATLTVHAAGREWTVTPAQLGFALDVPASIEAAYHLGRSGPLAQQLCDQARLLLMGKTLSLIGTYNARAMNIFLDRVAAQVNRPPQPAVLALTPSGPALRTPARDGLTLDRRAATARLAAAMERGQPATLDLPLAHSLPAISTAAAYREMWRLSHLMALKITLKAGAKTWLLTGSGITDLLRLETVRQGRNTVYTDRVDSAAVAAYIARLAREIDRAGTDARVTYGGGIVRVVPGRDGHVLNRAAAAAQLAGALAAGHSTVLALPIASGPTVSTAEATRVAAILQRAIRTSVVWLPQRHWVLTPAMIAGAVTIQRVAGADGAHLTAHIDAAVIAAHLPGSAALATVPARNAAVIRRSARYVVIPAVVGQHPDYEALAEEILRAPGPGVYHLPLRPTLPVLTTAQAEALARAHRTT